MTDEEIERESIRRLVDYASFFHNSPEGRRILSYLRDSLDGNTYRPGMDAMETAYRAGRRSVYLDILAAVGQGEEEIEAANVVKPQLQEAAMSVAIEDL